MRTCRVIRVAPEDDIVFLVNRVKESAGEALCFALSVQCTQFRNDVNLRLLAAYAREANVSVAFSTDDEETIARAAVHGIPTYRTPDQAFREEARVYPKADRRSRGSPVPPAVAAGQGVRVRLAPVVAVLLVALLATVGTAFALLPRVEIQVVPAVLHHPVRVLLPADGLVEEEAVAVEAGVRVEATGERRVGEGFATGSAMLINSNDFAVTVPAGTLLRTDDGRTFRTLESVVVPAQVTEMYLDAPVSVTAGRAEVPVMATEPGSGGNVAEGSIRILDGSWPGLAVRNATPLQGGTDRIAVYVTAGDLERGRSLAAAALQEAWTAALADIQAAQASLWVIGAAPPGEIVYEADVPEGEEVDAFTVTARAVGWIERVDRERLEEAVLARIAGELPAGFRRHGASSHEIRIHRYNKEEQTLELEILVPVVAEFDAVTLARQVAGRRTDEAAAFLEALPGVAAVHVSGADDVLPAWAPWIAVHWLDPSGGGEAR